MMENKPLKSRMLLLWILRVVIFQLNTRAYVIKSPPSKFYSTEIYI